MTAQESPLQEHLDRVSSPSAASSKTFTKGLVTTTEQFEQLLDKLRNVEGFAYDTETNGTFDRFAISIVGLSIAFEINGEAEAYYIPLLHLYGHQLDIEYVLDQLKPFFESSSWYKICHNAKFDEMVLSRHGIDVQGVGHDTYVMAWLLSEDSGSKGLKPLVLKHFGIEMETYEDVIASAPKKKGVPRDFNFARVELDAALSYAADDAFWALQLYNLFKAQLEKEKLWPAYNVVERPFTRVLRNIEARGVAINQELLRHADERLPKLAEEVEGNIYEMAGEVFNIGSPPQLGHILFEKLGIGKNVPLTASGNYSTSQKTLKTYATRYKIVEDVLRRKKIKKTHSTFVEGLKGFVGKDGRVHPSFNGCGTVTGRLSCSSPNLQQIEGDEVEEIRIRDFFVPREGHVFVVSDYSQVELRMMAHFSKDVYMTKAFFSGTEDFHEEIARMMFEVPDGQEVTRKQRVVAKTLNFGVGYGRGPTGIAEQLGISMDEAKEFIANWFKKFEGVGAYQRHVVSEARKHGYVRTLTGRKRRLLPDIRSDEWMLRGRAERQAFNTKIQGSSADLIKMAMVALEPELLKLDSFMCIQIHDEIVTEAPADRAPEVLETMKHIMENPFNGKNPLRVPLVADPKIVIKWGDAK